MAARSTSQIENSILAAIASNPVLSIINSPSQAAIYTQLAYVIASAQAIEEQLNDRLVSQVESVVRTLPPANGPWIQQQAFNFQYSASNPQIIQSATGMPYYTNVNDAYKIVTNCSVSQQGAGNVAIKVATGQPGSTPQPLSTIQLQALQYYFSVIKPMGIIYNISSNPADKLYSAWNITAQGAYSGNITTNLLNAYNNYLNSISFGGIIKFVDILQALRNVTGVIDVKCNQMVARPDSTTFSVTSLPGNTVMVSNGTPQGTAQYGQTEYTTAAGYIIGELSPNDFLSNLIINYPPNT
jgi:hypothetical protein